MRTSYLAALAALVASPALADADLPEKIRCVSLVTDHYDKVNDFVLELKVSGEIGLDASVEDIEIKGAKVFVNANNGCDNMIDIEFKKWRLVSLKKGKLDAVIGEVNYQSSGEGDRKFTVLCGLAK